MTTEGCDTRTCTLSLDYDTMQAMPQATLSYTNGKGENVEVRGCGPSVETPPVPLVPTIEGCTIRHAFAEDRSYQQGRLAGKATIVQARRSRSGRLGERHSVSDSQAEVARPLLTADEALRLGGLRKGRRGRVIPGEALIFAAGSPPMRGVQTLYFQDRTLRRRARLAPPEPPSEPPSEPGPP